MNRLVQHLKQRFGSWAGGSSVVGPASQILFLLIALGIPAISRGDTYGDMLDKRFEPQAKVAVTNAPALASSAGTPANVTAFEQEIKARANYVETGPPPPPPPNVNLGVATMIGVAVTALLALKVLFIISRVRANREAKAIKREEEFIQSVVQEPTVASLMNDLKHRLQPSAQEALPEAHSSVCSTELKKADDTAFIEAAVEVFESAPLLMSQLRKRYAEISRHPDPATQLKCFEEFSQEIRPSKMAARIPALRSHRLLAIALEGFLKQLAARPQNPTPWRLQLVNETLELFEDLCVPNLSPDLATKPPIRLLVVDDCAVSRHAMIFALKKVFHEPDLADGGKPALELAAKNAYDVIFLDIQMPEMDGFELCERIRETSLNKKTPIVFVTSHDNLESRAKIVTKGAQDLIGKPYLPTEIALKALQLTLHGRLKYRPAETAASEAPKNSSIVAPFSALGEASGAV